MIALEPDGVEFISVRIGAGSTRARYRTDLTGMRMFLTELRSALKSRTEPNEVDT